MITSLPYAPIRTDAEVIGFVREQLRRNDPRFAGDSPRARRRRQRAELAAAGVLDWWRLNRSPATGCVSGTDEQCAMEASRFVAKSVGGILLTLFGSILLQWVEKLVMRLLIEWLRGMAGASYRAASTVRPA